MSSAICMSVRRRVLTAHVPVRLTMPDQMHYHAQKVLAGEYEPGYFGEGLSIVDLGANVGSFSVWANMRWPGSTVHAYEPHPETFRMLTENVRGIDNIICHNAAVFSGTAERALYFSRYAGDGESGLAAVMSRTFAEIQLERTFEVQVVHPASLPGCDVLKVDVEGSEFEILANMDLSGVSIILLEFQFAEVRDNIKDLLAADFTLEHESNYPWDRLLPNSGYRKELAGDFYGLLRFSSRHVNKLKKVDLERPAEVQRSFRQALSELGETGKAALRRRLRL